MPRWLFFFFFFFNDTATTEIYTLSLHDALPIFKRHLLSTRILRADRPARGVVLVERGVHLRSEEHTSELQSQSNLVCRLLLEKKKKRHTTIRPSWLSCPEVLTTPLPYPL